MDLKEVKRIVKEYYDLVEHMNFGYSSYPRDLLITCEKLEALGFEWGDKLSFTDFVIRKGGEYKLTNSATHYKFDPDTWYIHWDNGNIGRYQFVDGFGYHYTMDEWNEFRDALMSYEPVDYDPANCHIVYDIEHGKKLLKDYRDICVRTQKKMDKKVAEARIEAKRKEIEKLQKELEEEY